MNSRLYEILDKLKENGWNDCSLLYLCILPFIESTDNAEALIDYLMCNEPEPSEELFTVREIPFSEEFFERSVVDVMQNPPQFPALKTVDSLCQKDKNEKKD